MGKPGLRSGRNLFLRLGGRLPRPGWRLRLRGPGRFRDRGRGAGAKHDIKHAAPYLVALGGRRRWWWCAWLGHGASLVWYPSIAWSLSAARNRRLAEQHAAPASRRCCRPLAASTQEGGPAKVTRDNESLLAPYPVPPHSRGSPPAVWGCHSGGEEGGALSSAVKGRRIGLGGNPAKPRLISTNVGIH